MQQVDANENVLVGSRSQMSSFMVQNDRIQALEQEALDVKVSNQKLQAQLKSATSEKERLIKEKAELEARLRHEMAEQLKLSREKIEEQMRDTVQENNDMKREINELRQAQKTDKTNFLRKSAQQDKQMQFMQVDIVEKDGTI